MDPLQTVLNYHEATKHHPRRMAQSLGYMDWAKQPNPFRRFKGAPATALRLLEPASTPTYDALHSSTRIGPRPLSLGTISELFQYSLALSAWKAFQGSRWALRINPSSGNLHPTEGYVVLSPLLELENEPGVFHYAPKEHALERRCSIRAECWDSLVRDFPHDTFFAGLTSIHWREAWKYGERAYRYCQHDVGHALAALSLSAAIQGWRTVPLSTISDQQIATLMGLDRREDFENAEREHPELLVAIVTNGRVRAAEVPRELPSLAMEEVGRGHWQGRANRLSRDHVYWEVINDVAEACTKPRSACGDTNSGVDEFPDQLEQNREVVAARQIVRQRRSAVAFDGTTQISAEQFFLMMDRVLPRYDRPPWNAVEPPAFVHLGLFVHRVEELEPGLYCLVRRADEKDRLARSMREEFEWGRPIDCPGWIPLYRLMVGDARSAAGQLSCGQGIAADGVFSLGMFAEFEGPLRKYGAWLYRRLFHETGMIGQVLYLEAEAAGIRGTGIGCFFDDPVHDLFGLQGTAYQSLYHFTVGGSVEDARLTTIPPYGQQDDRRP